MRPLDAYACVTTWEVPTLAINESTKGMVDIILAMEVGQGLEIDGTFLPAKSNLEIAKIASDVRLRFNVPIFAQDEAATCLRTYGEPADLAFIKEGPYADSYEVVRSFVSRCRLSQIKNVLVVTHPLHQWRIMRLVAHFGLVPYAADCSAVQFDGSSVQEWCRSEEAFRSYEFKARMLYLGRGWI